MSTLVIGIGNEWRRDDGAGLAVVRSLAGSPGVTIRELPDAGLDLLEGWRGFSDVIVVDAMRSGLPPGSVRWFSWQAVPAAAFGLTTHAIELRGALELAHALGRLPASVRVCGIEGARFDEGRELSASVAEAIPAAVQQITAFAAAETHSTA